MTPNQQELAEKAEEYRDQGKDEQASELDLLSGLDLAMESEDITEESPGNHTTSGCSIPASSIHPMSMAWIDDGYRFAYGENVLIVGDSGVGKTLLTCKLAADYTQGRKTPEGTPGDMGHVLMITPEDKYATKIIPALIAAGADMAKVHLMSRVQIKAKGSGQSMEERFRIPDHFAQLEEEINRYQIGMVILDPFMAIVSKRIATGRNQNVRQDVVEPLEDVAARTGACIIMVGHFNKGRLTDPEAIKQAVGASKGLTDAYRTIHVVLKTSQPGVVVFANVKHNAGPESSDMCYEIASVGKQRWPTIKFTSGYSPEFIKTRNEQIISEKQDNIIHVLQSENRMLTSHEINALAKVKDYDDCRKQLYLLTHDGLIVRPYRNQYCSLDYYVNNLQPKTEEEKKPEQTPIESMPTTIIGTNGTTGTIGTMPTAKIVA